MYIAVYCKQQAVCKPQYIIKQCVYGKPQYIKAKQATKHKKLCTCTALYYYKGVSVRYKRACGVETTVDYKAVCAWSTNIKAK